MRLSVIGGGSTYTPGLVARLLETKIEEIPVDELVLMDIDQERLAIIGRFVERQLAQESPRPIDLELTTDLGEAVTGADFVVIQIRVGGNEQRVVNEKLSLEYGIAGHETIGPPAFALALAQIPAALRIAREVRDRAPEAWIISVANPAGILAEALLKHGHPKSLGMCHGGLMPRQQLAALLGIEENRIEFDYKGFNHLAWVTSVHVDGRRLDRDEMAELAAKLYADWCKSETTLTPEFARDFKGTFPLLYYADYFYFQKAKLQAMQNAGRTRGEEVLQVEKECLEHYRKATDTELPSALAHRGGHLEFRGESKYGPIGYSDGCLETIAALLDPVPRRLIINVLNEGSCPDFDDDVCIELPALVSQAGYERLHVGRLPLEVRGLMHAVKAYETLTIEAAVTGDREVALKALLAHPSIGYDYELAKSLLEDILTRNREYLPQFFD